MLGFEVAILPRKLVCCLILFFNTDSGPIYLFFDVFIKVFASWKGSSGSSSACSGGKGCSRTRITDTLLFVGFGRFIQFVWSHTHIVEDIGQLPGVDATIVSYIALAPFMYVEVTHCNFKETHLIFE